MSIFIAPDAEGTLTVWARVPDKDPVALINRVDLFNAGLPTAHRDSPEFQAAVAGLGWLWQLMVIHTPLEEDAEGSSK